MHEDEELVGLEHEQDAFGAKTIGTFASFILSMNNMMGNGGHLGFVPCCAHMRF